MSLIHGPRPPLHAPKSQFSRQTPRSFSNVSSVSTLPPNPEWVNLLSCYKPEFCSSLQWPRLMSARKQCSAISLEYGWFFKEIGSFPGSSQRPEHFLLKSLQKVFRSMVGAWTRPLSSFQSEIGVTCGQLHSPTVIHVFKEKVEVMNIELGSRGPFPAQQLLEARQVMCL